jgi:predicted HNH restriction endonuclease
MSQRIHQIVSVIEEIRENYRIQPSSWSLRGIRNQATNTVAEHLNITKQSVESKFITQLQPHIKNANHFDELVKAWLYEGSDDLRNILQRFAKSTTDKEQLNALFHRAPEEEILLAQEFGLDPSSGKFKEGKDKLKIHLAKERSRSLIASAKQKWSVNGKGDIKCSICTFSFKEKYGPIGDGFIEAHHIQPISSLAPDTIMKFGDIIPVCSNCHSMLHHNRTVSIEKLRASINSTKS